MADTSSTLEESRDLISSPQPFCWFSAPKRRLGGQPAQTLALTRSLSLSALRSSGWLAFPMVLDIVLSDLAVRVEYELEEALSRRTLKSVCRATSWAPVFVTRPSF